MPIARAARASRSAPASLGAIALVAVLVAGAAGAGCIDAALSAETAAMCETNVECAPGQVCRDGLCFGNPPDLQLAAVLIPSTAQHDQVAPAEIEDLKITNDGRAELSFPASVEITGRVLVRPGDALSVAAKVVLRRRSRIAGLPDYVVSAVAQPGQASGEIAFRAKVAPNEAGERYEAVISPDDGTLFQPSGDSRPPAEYAPPTRILLPELGADAYLDLTLADASGLKEVHGSVLDAAGRGVSSVRVRARGRRSTSAAWEIASSLGRTDASGAFVVYLPVSWDNTFELVVEPSADQAIPSLRRTGVVVDDPQLGTPVTLEPLRYPSFPRAVTYTVPVVGKDTSGGKRPADGTLVRFTTQIAETATDRVVYTADAIVTASGAAQVVLIPGTIDGNRLYAVEALPPGNAPFGAVWDGVAAVGPPNPDTGQGGVLAEMMLPPRVFVSGRVVDVFGAPAARVVVEARLSPVLTAPLADDARARALRLSLAQVATDDEGRFGLFLDPLVAGLAALYDLELVPPAGSVLPRWSRDGIALATSGVKLDLGDVYLPGSSLAWARILGPASMPVPDAEARVFVLNEGLDVCVTTSSTTECHPPARLRVLARSGRNGDLVLVLPSP